MSKLRLRVGETVAGQGWQPYPNGKGIYIVVNTKDADFTNTPLYLTSIDGTNEHWGLVGVNAIYHPTNESFRVYVQWRNGAALTPATAKKNGWQINWVGYETVPD